MRPWRTLACLMGWGSARINSKILPRISTKDEGVLWGRFGEGGRGRGVATGRGVAGTGRGSSCAKRKKLPPSLYHFPSSYHFPLRCADRHQAFLNCVDRCHWQLEMVGLRLEGRGGDTWNVNCLSCACLTQRAGTSLTISITCGLPYPVQRQNVFVATFAGSCQFWLSSSQRPSSRAAF